MSAEEWKEGDLVVLKSGGPVMTVKDTYMDNVYCAWFSGKKHEGGDFKPGMLRAKTDDDK